MEITRETLKAFRKDLESAVADLEKKYEVVLEFGSISYSQNSFSVKLTATKGANDADAERHKFISNVWAVARYGLGADDYGRKFSTMNGVFELVGVKPRSPKNPLIIRNEQGKEYVCAPSFLGLTLQHVYRPGQTA